MKKGIWDGWVADWESFLARYESIGWDVDPLVVEAPTTATRIAEIEARLGLPFPAQLREVALNYANAVHFGWSTPSHLHPMDLYEGQFPTLGGLMGPGSKLFDITAIVETHQSFRGWKDSNQNITESEAYNDPKMWENQVCIATVSNGDMITIDVSNPDGADQPVRYFSHELEGWHGFEIGANFVSFLTEYSKLGCAGNTHDDWFALVDDADEKKRIAHLDASSNGAKSWFAYLDAGGQVPGVEHPPLPIPAKNKHDLKLLNAARKGNPRKLEKALEAGAEINCTWDIQTHFDKGYWEQKHWTALSYALTQGDLKMATHLFNNGAVLDTRYPAANAAVKSRNPEVLTWVIQRGGRVNGWPGQRYWPLHDVVNDFRSEMESREAEKPGFENFITDEMRKLMPQDQINDMIKVMQAAVDDQNSAPKFTDENYVKMLTLLLKAGADPNARWDNGLSMLHWGGSETAKILLEHGADVEAKDNEGKTAMNFWPDEKKAKVLRDFGAKGEPPVK